MNGLLGSLVGGLLLVCSVSQAEDRASPVPYSRRGELSPGTEAPSQREMVRAVQTGSADRLRATLEYGERVVCEACVPLLASKLVDSEDARVREISAWWLRRQVAAAPVVLTALRARMGSERDPVRRARVAEALGEFMDHHALKELAAAVREDPDAGVRAAAVRAVRRLNSDGGASVVAGALADKSEEVRLAALSAVLSVRGFSANERLVALLDDAVGTVRQRAARALGELRVREAEAALSRRLDEDTAVPVRKAAAFALGRIGGARGQAALARARQREQDALVLDAIDVARRMPIRP